MSETLLKLAVGVQTRFAALRDREDGQTMAEYALILAGIAILVLLAVVFLGGEIEELFEETGNSIESAPANT
jgi:pilus assembly protein Flp/PilA